MRVAGTPGLTHTHSHVVDRCAVSTLTAHVGQRARVYAARVNARLQSVAVVAVGAFQADAFQARVAPGLRGTPTDSLVTRRHTLCVATACAGNLTRVAAAIVEACGGSRTVRVRETVSRVATSSFDGVADEAISAETHEASWSVLATAKKGEAR